MSLWKRLWRRDTPPPPPETDDPKINEDWKAGDMAECIAPFFWPFAVPLEGDVYVVADVALSFFEALDAEGNRIITNRKGFGLQLRGHHLKGRHWTCDAFRKVHPIKDEETLDIGLSETIKRCNPAPVEAGANANERKRTPEQMGWKYV